MIRSEISLFSKNVPGELGKLTARLADAGVGIDAITIQDATSYVKELFNARGKSLKRIASAASYNSMSKDSAEFALIRLLPAADAVDKAVELLVANGYLYDTGQVIAMELENHPGALAHISSRLGSAGVNINYVYGSATTAGDSGLLVLCPDDIDAAAQVLSLPQ